MIQFQKSSGIDNAGTINMLMAAYCSCGDIESVKRVLIYRTPKNFSFIQCAYRFLSTQ